MQYRYGITENMKRRSSVDEWPYEDVVRDDPLTALRIPVVNTFSPERGFLGAFLKDWTEEDSPTFRGYPFRSSARPTDEEVRMLLSYIEEEKSQFRHYVIQEMDACPLDHHRFNNGRMFIKYGPDDWGYRRLSWERGHVFIPPPLQQQEKDPRYRDLGRFTLEQAMDYGHNHTAKDPQPRWAKWKAEHPDVFSNP